MEELIYHVSEAALEYIVYVLLPPFLDLFRIRRRVRDKFPGCTVHSLNRVNRWWNIHRIYVVIYSLETDSSERAIYASTGRYNGIRLCTDIKDT